MSIKTLFGKAKNTDIASVIQKLQNIDIQDLKNINISQVKAFFQSRLDVVIHLIFIVITLMVVITVGGGHKKKITLVKENTIEARETLEVLTVFQGVQKQYKDFIKDFPEALLSDKLIDKIFALAVDHNIQIVSFSPVQENSDDYAKFIRVNISISSDSYADIVRFVYDMERPSSGMQIEKWESEKIDDQNKAIKVNLAIGSVKLEK